MNENATLHYTMDLVAPHYNIWYDADYYHAIIIALKTFKDIISAVDGNLKWGICILIVKKSIQYLAILAVLNAC